MIRRGSAGWSGAAAAIAASRTSAFGAPARAAALIHAARLLLPTLERGHPIDAAVLRSAMEQAIGSYQQRERRYGRTSEQLQQGLGDEQAARVAGGS